ncbi:MAG TPA: aspartate kinase [Thermoclostridium sp.]|nr:aspartate kinase [Thermoclostridium sp.]
MTIVVQKYGGTSIGTIEKIQQVAQKIIQTKIQGYKVVVVVSAMGKTTDELLKMAYSMSKHPPKRELDMLLSTGEQVSISLLSIALNEQGHSAISFTGPQVGIKTTGFHTKSKISEIDGSRIREALEDDKIIIVAGFQGVNAKDDITTLGRGGSDTTAVALAASLGAKCYIYTDVDGIYSIDPRVYSDAKKLHTITFEEMLEMASLGAGVMHYRAIELGEKFNVPIYVSSSVADVDGTLIKESDNMMEGPAITGMAINNDDAMISLNHVPHKIELIASIFNSLAKGDINIDMISQTSPQNELVSISFTLPKEDLIDGTEIINSCINEYPKIHMNIKEDITKLSVVGIGMRSQSGVAAKMFMLLAMADIPIHMVTTSEIKISYVIHPKDQQNAVETIAKAFNL